MWDDICELLKYKEKGDVNMENKEQEIKKYTLTIPDELLEDLKKEANQKGMSLNAYILSLISKNI